MLLGKSGILYAAMGAVAGPKDGNTVFCCPSVDGGAWNVDGQSRLRRARAKHEAG